MDIHSQNYKDNNQRDLIYLHRGLSLPLRRNVPNCRKVVCPVHCSRVVWEEAGYKEEARQAFAA